MTMRVQCTGCGEDCSHAYGTWMGDPYHFGCIPTRSKRHMRDVSDEQDDLERLEGALDDRARES